MKNTITTALKNFGASTEGLELLSQSDTRKKAASVTVKTNSGYYQIRLDLGAVVNNNKDYPRWRHINSDAARHLNNIENQDRRFREIAGRKAY